MAKIRLGTGHIINAPDGLSKDEYDEIVEDAYSKISPQKISPVGPALEAVKQVTKEAFAPLLKPAEVLAGLGRKVGELTRQIPTTPMTLPLKAVGFLAPKTTPAVYEQLLSIPAAGIGLTVPRALAQAGISAGARILEKRPKEEVALSGLLGGVLGGFVGPAQRRRLPIPETKALPPPEVPSLALPEPEPKISIPETRKTLPPPAIRLREGLEKSIELPGRIQIIGKEGFPVASSVRITGKRLRGVEFGKPSPMGVPGNELSKLNEIKRKILSGEPTTVQELKHNFSQEEIMSLMKTGKLPVKPVEEFRFSVKETAGIPMSEDPGFKIKLADTLSKSARESGVPREISSSVVSDILRPDKTKVSTAFGIEGKLKVPEITPVKKQGRLAGLFLKEPIIKARGREAGITAKTPLGDILVDEVRTAEEKTAAFAASRNFELDQLNRILKPSKQELAELEDLLEGRTKSTGNTKVQRFFNVIDRQRKEYLDLAKSQNHQMGEIRDFMHHEIPHPNILKNEKNPLTVDILSDMIRRGDANSPADALAQKNSWVEFFEDRGTGEYLKKRLVQNGKAANMDEAASIVDKAKRFSKKQVSAGPFSERAANLPFYDPNPLRAQVAYNQRASKILYDTERFGNNGEALLNIAQKTDALKNVGASDIVNDFLQLNKKEERGFLSILRTANVLSKMTLAAIGNFSQGFIGTSLTLGPKRAFGTAGFLLKNYRLAKDLAVKSGGISPKKLSEIFMDVPTGIASKVLKVVGMNRTETDNYIFSSVAARAELRDLFKLIKENPFNKKYQRGLKELGMKAEDVLKKQSPSEMDYSVASQKLYKKSQGIPDYFNQPGWSFTEWGKTFAQFKRTAYNQTRLVWNEAIKHPTPGKLFTLLVLYPSVGEVIGDTKSFIQDLPFVLAGGEFKTLKKRLEKVDLERPLSKKNLERYLLNMSSAFAFGIMEDIWRASRGEYQMANFLIGAGGQTMAKGGAVIGEIARNIYERKPMPFKPIKKLARELPIAGRFF